MSQIRETFHQCEKQTRQTFDEIEFFHLRFTLPHEMPLQREHHMVATNLIKVEEQAGGLSGRIRGRPGAAGRFHTENGWISFWRAWTVNYGRYCPPANNRPPHYMWELLTADRLGGSLSAAT